MFRYMIAWSLIFYLFGCEDNPYREPVAGPPLALSEHNFEGMVEIGAPVSGANIAAYQFDGLVKGKKIAEAISSPQGNYNLKIKTAYDGPLLLVASGGLYRDLITEEMVAVKPGQELRSAITHIRMPEKTNINAWTTLAVARVQADRGFWDKSVAELKDIDRINVDFTHMSYFLTGKSPSFVNIRRQEFFDVANEAFKQEDPRVTLHLAHGGLGKLASDFSASLAESGIIVSVMDLILALADDLSDRIFDGHNASGNVVYIGKNNRINLSSYTMRKGLSEAILLYSKQLYGRGKLSEEDRIYLQRPGRLIDALARETQPELFPEAEKPKPIDKEPPVLKIDFSGPSRGAPQFSFLGGNVAFDVEASDDSKVLEIKLLEPKILTTKTNSAFGPVLVNSLPQAMYAAQVCGKERELRAEIDKRELSEANIVCACFEATDIFGNASKELSCFQRAVLKSTISYPNNQAVLSSKSFRDGVRIRAYVTSGLPITECTWEIRARLDGEVDEGVLPSGDGKIDGTTCTVDEALDGSKFFNGAYHLVLQAKDLGERMLSNKQDGIYQSVANFQVFMEPPAVEVTSPANNAYLATNYIPISGIVEHPDKISEIEVSYKSIRPDNTITEGRAIVPVNKDKREWAVFLGTNLEPGSYNIALLVKDIFGNQKEYPPRSVVIDHEGPTILGPQDGVPQSPYIQETMNYRQAKLNDNGAARYVIEPIGEPVPISWRRTPRISRWASRLDDAATAPRYTIRAHDDNKLKEVRYKLHYKCSPFEEANKKANFQDDRFDIWFTQSAASFDLSRDSEADGHSQKYCLSIWAIDEAGNATNHNVEFIWKVVVPPVALDMNSTRYRAHRHDDDISSINLPMWTLFRRGNPMGLKKDLVLAHTILSNPHSEAVSAKLELKKPLDLDMSCGKYQIPENTIEIRYFAYDLAKDEVGPEKTLNDLSVVLNAQESVVAKFILAKDVAINGVPYPQNSFWDTFKFQVGFAKLGNDKPMVDGLRLITRDPLTGMISNEPQFGVL